MYSNLYNEWIDNALKELSRMANLDRLTLTNSIYLKGETGLIRNQFLFECNESKRVSIHLSFFGHSIKRTDIWETFCRYKDLKELTFCFPDFDFLSSLPNIEPLFHLKEISIECSLINNGFFGNIVQLAPNLEVFELKSRFDLTNKKLKKLSELKLLSKIKLLSTEKTDHDAEDEGFIGLLDNCSKLEK